MATNAEKKITRGLRSNDTGLQLDKCQGENLQDGTHPHQQYFALLQTRIHERQVERDKIDKETERKRETRGRDTVREREKEANRERKGTARKIDR